jgi:hypothetical protein
MAELNDTYSRKRQKLSCPPPTSSTSSAQPIGNSTQTAKMDESETKVDVTESGFLPDQERHVGILHFVNVMNPGFTAVFKQRYVSRASSRSTSCFSMMPSYLLSNIICLLRVCLFNWLYIQAYVIIGRASLVRSLILNSRYSDFLVNEIDRDGKVEHFTTDKVPKSNGHENVRSNDNFIKSCIQISC